MGLIDTIKRAEERSKQAARRGLDLARQGWDDTERAMRRKWRIFPTQVVASQAENGSATLPVRTSPREINPPAGSTSVPNRTGEKQPSPPEAEGVPRRPIISINGRDVENDVAEKRDDGEEAPGKRKSA